MKLVNLTVLGVLGLAAVSAAEGNAATLYDSDGFEQSAGYTAGYPLAGQPGASPALQWQQYPFGLTDIAATVIKYSDSGQGVQVQRYQASDFGYWNPSVPFTPNTTTPGADDEVNITWQMYVQSGAVGSSFFGITAYDQNTHVIASVGIDPSSDDIVYTDADGTHFTNSTISPNIFYSYDLLLNYSAQKFTFSVDGSPVLVDYSFAKAPTDPDITTFSDADITTYNNSDKNETSTGVAFFDNYKIESEASTPEPAGVALLVVSGVAAIRRRVAV